MFGQEGIRKRQTTPSPYSPYGTEEEDAPEEKPAQPAKNVGLGMLLGATIAAAVIIVFIYTIQEERWQPDLVMHSKVVEQHKRDQASHDLLHGHIRKAEEAAKSAPAVPPTKEEIEAQQLHDDLHDHDDEHDAAPEAEGMFDSLGHQLHDTDIDLNHHLDEFWEHDKNKDAFLSQADFEHVVRRPVTPERFKALDKNKDGAVSIREFTAGFTHEHIKEPWFHHKYGFVYGDDIPDHFDKAKVGAVKKGDTQAHAEAKEAKKQHDEEVAIKERKEKADHAKQEENEQNKGNIPAQSPASKHDDDHHDGTEHHTEEHEHDVHHEDQSENHQDAEHHDVDHHEDSEHHG